MVTTKAGHRKLPSNVLFVPIDTIPFHSKECMFKWKYVMKRQIADEFVISDQHRSCADIIEMVEKARMMCTINNLGVFYPKLVWDFIVTLFVDFNESETLDFSKCMYGVRVFMSLLLC